MLRSWVRLSVCCASLRNCLAVLSTGVTEIHASARSSFASNMKFRRSGSMCSVSNCRMRFMCVYICVCVEGERERKRKGEREKFCAALLSLLVLLVVSLICACSACSLFVLSSCCLAVSLSPCHLSLLTFTK